MSELATLDPIAAAHEHVCPGCKTSNALQQAYNEAHDQWTHIEKEGGLKATAGSRDELYNLQIAIARRRACIHPQHEWAPEPEPVEDGYSFALDMARRAVKLQAELLAAGVSITLEDALDQAVRDRMDELEDEYDEDPALPEQAAEGDATEEPESHDEVDPFAAEMAAIVAGGVERLRALGSDSVAAA